jgi:hypothetical protein
MGREIRVGLAQGVVAVAGPPIVRRVIDHGRAHRVELDVAELIEPGPFHSSM